MSSLLVRSDLSWWTIPTKSLQSKLVVKKKCFPFFSSLPFSFQVDNEKQRCCIILFVSLNSGRRQHEASVAAHLINVEQKHKSETLPDELCSSVLTPVPTHCSFLCFPFSSLLTASPLLLQTNAHVIECHRCCTSKLTVAGGGN